MWLVAVALVFALLAYSTSALARDDGWRLVLINSAGLPGWLDLGLTAGLLAALSLYFWPHEPGGA